MTISQFSHLIIWIADILGYTSLLTFICKENDFFHFVYRFIFLLLLLSFHLFLAQAPSETSLPSQGRVRSEYTLLSLGPTCGIILGMLLFVVVVYKEIISGIGYLILVVWFLVLHLLLVLCNSFVTNLVKEISQFVVSRGYLD